MVIIMAVPNKERLNIDGRTDNGSSRKETDYNKKAKALINRILDKSILSKGTNAVSSSLGS